MIEACGWALAAAGSGRSVIKVFPSVTPAWTAEGASGLQHRAPGARRLVAARAQIRAG